MNRSRISARFCALACASLSILAMAGCTASFTSSSPQSAQTISFAAVGSQTVGATVTLSATASSGLPVSFASESPLVCAVSGTTATMSATGTCVLEAMQTGDSLYLPVNTVEEVAVGGESQTIAFANPGTQTVGTPLTLSATATSGLTVSFASQTTSVCTVSGATAKFLEAGSCTIQATQAGNTIYAAAAPVSQSFTVNAASLTAQTITFNNPGAQTVGTPLTLVGHGQLRLDRLLRIDHTERLHGQRHGGDARCLRHLRDPGHAGRQHNLRRGHAGLAELHGECGYWHKRQRHWLFKLPVASRHRHAIHHRHAR